MGSARTTITNTSLSAVNMDLDTDEETAVKEAVSLAEQALAAAKEVRFLRESKSASDAQRKAAEARHAEIQAEFTRQLNGQASSNQKTSTSSHTVFSALQPWERPLSWTDLGLPQGRPVLLEMPRCSP